MKDELIQSGSKEALQQNIKTEIESGKDPKQAAAIAYSVQRANDANNVELLYCVIEFTESSYFGLTSKVGKQISLDEADTLIRNADKAYQTNGVKGCYEKTYLDLYVRYNNHKYKIHLLRFDVSDGPTHMNVKEKVNNVLNRVPELVTDNRYISYNYVKQLDEAQKVTDYLEPKYTLQKLKDFPLESRNFMKQQTNKEAGYLMLLSQAEDMYNECEPQLKADVKLQVNKVLQDICTQFNLKQCKQIKDRIMKDGYTGEIRNIAGKQFKGADGKIYEMPNYTYAMYCPEHNAYYGFKNQNNMPYAPVGGKQALQQVLGAGGFLNVDNMIFVKPIKDANTVLREYHKYENGKLETAQLIKHNNSYTFVASNPKDDKDSDTLQGLEQFIAQKGYKPLY